MLSRCEVVMLVRKDHNQQAVWLAKILKAATSVSLVQLVHAALVSASWSVVAVTRRDNISAAALGSWVAAVSAAQLLGAAVGAQLGPRSSLNTLRLIGRVKF